MNGKLEFSVEAHHLPGGDNSLDALAVDIGDFIKWQVTHSTNKRLKYDKKKFINYYYWNYNDIAAWFKEQKREFRYPVFLIDVQSTIGIKISVGMDIRSRRLMHDQTKIPSTMGNGHGSHKTVRLGGDSREHIIYINTYRLAFECRMSVGEFIASTFFDQELAWAVKHEFMHTYDTYFIKGFGRMQVNRMKKIYNAYRKANDIDKKTVTLGAFGTWNGKTYNVDKDYLLSENHLRDFFYMLPYYFAKTEMNAYLQTFSNQLSISNTVSEYDCDIYKRYISIKRILQTDMDEATAEKLLDEKFVSDFTTMFQKLKTPLAADRSYKKMCECLIDALDKYLHKMHKILYDCKSIFQ